MAKLNSEITLHYYEYFSRVGLVYRQVPMSNVFNVLCLESLGVISVGHIEVYTELHGVIEARVWGRRRWDRGGA